MVGQVPTAVADQHAPRSVVEIEVDLQTVVRVTAAQCQVPLHLPAVVLVMKDALRAVQMQRGLALETAVLERHPAGEGAFDRTQRRAAVAGLKIVPTHLSDGLQRSIDLAR